MRFGRWSTRRTAAVSGGGGPALLDYRVDRWPTTSQRSATASCSPPRWRRRWLRAATESSTGASPWLARTATTWCSSLGELPAKGYASHGESWSFALALRLAAYDLLRSDGGEPVLVLDDVFAELDDNRRESLAELVAPAEQVLVTAAVAGDVPTPAQRRALGHRRRGGAPCPLSRRWGAVPPMTAEYLGQATLPASCWPGAPGQAGAGQAAAPSHPDRAAVERRRPGRPRPVAARRCGAASWSRIATGPGL